MVSDPAPRDAGATEGPPDLWLSHAVGPGPPRAVTAWRRLPAISAWLTEVRAFCQDPPSGASKAAEWFLDNEYHIRRAIRQVREDMPEPFYRRLPPVADEALGRLPRVFLAAGHYLDLTHDQPQLASARAFVNAYQDAAGLRLAELWAFPAMLRLSEIERIVAAFEALSPALGLSSPLRRRDTPDGPVDPTGAISRAVMALAAVERIDWRDFVEDTSRVEAILAAAPDGLHRRMDFETRDRYRTAIERIAETGLAEEPDVARVAVRLAEGATSPRRRHVGWWLIDAGLPRLRQEVGVRVGRADALRAALLRRPGLLYAAALVSLTLTALAAPVALLAAAQVGWPALAAAVVLLLLPASIIAVTLTNWLVTQTLPPRILPKLDFSKGLPDDMMGAVIVPAILHGPDEAASLLRRIEQHWLTNADPRLRIALLSDPPDAPERVAPGDAALEEALVAGVRRLNQRYAQAAPFVLLHRRRRFNRADGIWMGWDRKRGKIEEFNAFLLDGADDAFAVREGDVAGLRGARLVVTLDADTIAPPGAVRRLLGTLSHPLNRAEFVAGDDRPVAGYTFIQPRIEISPDAGSHSLFSRLYTGDTAIDIYSRAVSDVYQDLFGEGVFTGKGAYDATAFRRSLGPRVPENLLVSHDLFEGLHGRAALASDIVLYEGFPTRYPDFARRLHRWIRGDWQLVQWLGRSVPVRGGGRAPNRLSLIDRWKILDNLRRSVIAPSLVLLALTGWLAAPGLALLWTALVVAAPATYLLIDIGAGLSRGRRRGAVRDRWRQFGDHAGRWFLEIVFMSHEAVISLDAIARALWRLCVSHRKLMEWTSAAHVSLRSGHGRAEYWRDMAGGSLVGVALAAILGAVAPQALVGAAPLIVAWTLSPEIARFVGRPLAARRETLSPDDRAWLRQLARRTWAYFETFAGPEDNWLPPDNVQTDPHTEIAHRSSPTNVGMGYLSSLAALDLGFATLRDVAQRSAFALDAASRIERHRGHVVNWFDTRTLASLEPRYVSTVDSGNLAVSLLALREGLIEAADGPALSAALWDGFLDTLGLLGDAVRALGTTPPQDALGRLDAIADRARAARGDASAWRACLLRLRDADLPAVSAAIVPALDRAPADRLVDLEFWLDRSRHHVSAVLRDLDALCPWVALAEDGDAPARDLVARLPPDAPLPALLATIDALRAQLDGQAGAGPVRDALDRGGRECAALRARLLRAAETARAQAMGMDFAFLYDAQTRTFFIGYNLNFDQMDGHHYDLLASEARLASYFAIAKGDVPSEHWLHLGRPISHSSGDLTLLSWNGSMFEYLMPALLIRSAEGQLLGQSETAAVRIQRRYGDRLGLPWGVSEAAFAARDDGQRYQYRAFGVPGLGLRQGLARDYVVAAYASALALAALPRSAVANLRRLEGMGLSGRFGLFDAVDFTPARLRKGTSFTPVATVMAHHQGMSLAAMDNALHDDILVRRFNRDPSMAGMNLLLHERVPWEFVPEPLPDAGQVMSERRDRQVPVLHGWPADEGEMPQTHVIGNGRLSVWLTARATGTVWWRGRSLTRWTADRVLDDGTARLFLRSHEDDKVWDFTRTGAQWVDVEFHPAQASFHLRRGDVSATERICVAAGDDVEIRRVSLANHGPNQTVIDVTSYAEPVLAPHPEHERHPVFSKLFLHGTCLPDTHALAITRRPRRPEDTPPVMVHRLICETPNVRFEGVETDRRALLGRHGRAEAAARVRLTGGDGWTLDPVAALRARVTLAAGETAGLAFLTVAATSVASAQDTANRYATAAALDWAFEDAARGAAVDAERVGAGQSVVSAAQALAGHLLGPAGSAGDIDADPAGQNDLWGLGVSGDDPIVVVRVPDETRADLLSELLPAQAWLRRNGLRADLVLIGTGPGGYEAPIASRLRQVLGDAGLAQTLGGDSGIHLHMAERVTARQASALRSFARLTLDAAAPSLRDALPAPHRDDVKPPLFEPGVVAAPRTTPPLPPPAGLVQTTPYGGFESKDAAHVIDLPDGRTTPAPWCNVLANPTFGTIVSEAGLGFTWSGNSGEFRLTPWSSDPLTDPQGEALYLRDEETADVWTVTKLPAGRTGSCRVTHRTGETVWTRNSHGLRQTQSVCVGADAPVKLVRLRLENTTDRPRRLTATYSAEWQLGALPSTASPFVRTAFQATAGALVARNGWSADFAGEVAFLTASHPAHAMTCDRRAFLGTGDRQCPEGLRRWHPSGRTDCAGDACAVYQVHLDIEPHAAEEVVFVLGAASGADTVDALAGRFADPTRAAAEAARMRATWAKRLGAVQIDTPDPAFDLMVNTWLPYQAFSSRILARAGFYQASGGIGFRDQLQDMMAFLWSEPARVRAHILDCAGRQFEEGDVLHWWHPPAGRGVRTRCSDDMMWLVHATHRYVTATGDEGILSEEVPFLSAPVLAADEHDRYAAFDRGPSASLLDHCRRAMERGTATGAHGLPLIGSGDWNDGMDRIGARGRGESVWLAWFAAQCSAAYAELAGRAGRPQDAVHWHETGRRLCRAAERSAWDGAWYRRAYDDAGLPWGSAQNEECRIDSIAQSWAVLCDAPDRARSARALRAAADRLIGRDPGLVRLLAPPFDRTPRDPGYIRAYPPGVRENGGQYSHAATWMGMAFARLGDGDAAYEVFDLMNPIRHTATPADVERYRGEPYALAGDVGGAPPRLGRAGWTWYTGAAAWMWRLGVEGILGLDLRDGRLRVAPVLPDHWPGFTARLRGPDGTIEVVATRAGPDAPALVLAHEDGTAIDDATLAFPTGGRTLRVTARIAGGAVPPGH